MRYTILLLLAPPGMLLADTPVPLASVRRDALAYVESLQVPGKPLGWYFDGPGETDAPSLYASCDVAHLRTVMGEDLRKTLTTAQRADWVGHINSFARPDGTYGPARRGHSPQHANGMVVGALGVLGGKQKHPVQLYDALYGLAYMGSLAPEHWGADILDAARGHGRGLVAQWPAFLKHQPDLHVLLGAVGAVGAFGLLQQLLPETYLDSTKWTDIFSDPRLYRIRNVETMRK